MKIGLNLYPGYAYQLGQLIPQANGLFTVNWPLGTDTVLSMQPDGSQQTRPAGTAGAWELAQMACGRLVYGPYAQDFGRPDVVYIVPIVELS